MKAVVTYKQRGTYPPLKMTLSAKKDFRKKAKRFKLLDNGDLMKIETAEGVPTGELILTKFLVIIVVICRGT